VKDPWILQCTIWKKRLPKEKYHGEILVGIGFQGKIFGQDSI